MNPFAKSIDEAMGVRAVGDDLTLRQVFFDIDPLIKALSSSEEAMADFVRLDGFYDALFSDLGAVQGAEAQRLIKEAIDSLDEKAGDAIDGLRDRLNRMRTVLSDAPEDAPTLKVGKALTSSKSNAHVATSDMQPFMEEAWLSATSGNYGPKFEALFEKVKTSLDIRDPVVAEALGDMLQRSVQLSTLKNARRRFLRNGKVDPTSPAFRRFFRNHVSALKGKVVERWFYGLPVVKDKLLPELEQQAARRAKELNRLSRGGRIAHEAQVLTKTIRFQGREITDGMVVVLKRERSLGGKPGRVIGAYIDTIIEIKSEKNLTVLAQFERTMKRMGTGSSSKKFKLDLGEPGLEDVEILGLEIPKKVVVAPRTPTHSKFDNSFAAGDAAFLETALSAEDADDIGFVLLASLVESLG